MSGEVSITSVPNFDKLEVVKVYNLTINYTASSGQAQATVDHGLGYIPIPLGYLFDGSFYYPLNFILPTATTGVVIENHFVYTNETQLVVTLTKPTSSPGYGSASTVTYRVILLRLSATT